MFAPINIATQIYCGLQLAYFKANKFFIKFHWNQVPEEDINFLIKTYFPEETFTPKNITNHEYYGQVKKITTLYDYKLWNKNYLEDVYSHMNKSVRKDVSIQFILNQLLDFLNDKRIVRPGYTTLQDIISNVINKEHNRVENIVFNNIDDNSKKIIEKLLIRDDMLSYLAVLKQDAKDFKYKMMVAEREKLLTIKPLYLATKKLLPLLDISKQNIIYYADLVNYYTTFELRRFNPERLYLYIICYVWQRYMQLTDNLVNAFNYHLKKFEVKATGLAEENYNTKIRSNQKQEPIVGQLLNLYIDNNISDTMSFGEVREKYAFRLMKKETLINTAKQMIKKSTSEHGFKWKALDKMSKSFKLHLRPIFLELDFASSKTEDQLLSAVEKLKNDFSKGKGLDSKNNIETYTKTIPKKLKKHILITDETGEIKGLHANRYEFKMYSTIKKSIESGELYLDDSVSHRCFDDELIPLNDTELKTFNLSCLQKPIEERLNDLYKDLKKQWKLLDKSIRQNKSKHFQYDKVNKTLSFHKPKESKKERFENTIYEQLTPVDIVDVLHFVNKKCNFLSAFKPIQNRFVKNRITDNSLLAVIMSQSMNHGLAKFSKIADIKYDHLYDVFIQYFRKSNLEEANNIMSNFMSQLPIFEYYSFDLSTLYGSVDGQKLGSETPTIKSRHSKKHFGKGRGLVSFGLLVNYNPIMGYTIGSNEHESYFAFDIYYNNTTDINPDVITGDMHSINKVNFAILNWFDIDFRPRFSDLKDQLKHLYCGDKLSNYEKFKVKPVGEINKDLIIEEWPKIKQIIATLANKEMTQSNLIKKLCKYKQTRTLKAIFEYDKLIRSIYTLKYLRDFQLQKDVHRSQNRIEAYHQLRSIIAKVNGKKHIIGKTDIEIDINNQCARLLTNAIICYNSVLLSLILKRTKKSNDKKTIEKLKRISPVAWQHIHLLGHYIFNSANELIDLEEMVSKIIL
jgi:TnpA family transposase